MKSFYVGVGAVIEKNNQILVLKRSPEKDFAPNTWEVVTGRLEHEEEPEKGILREVLEEVKLEVDIILPVHTGFFYRGGKEFPMVFIVFWCKYLSGDVELSWEHNEYKWITLEEALELKNLEPFATSFRTIKRLRKHLPKEFKINNV